MTYLRNCWYMAGWATDLDDGPIGRTFLDQPVALFRDENLAPRAIAARCPHRFVRLSGGRIIEGALECPYHGLRFDGAGQCVHNPQGEPPRQAHIASFKLVERHAILWIWMGDQGQADPAKIPDLSCNDPDRHHVCGDYLHMEADYRLCADNILDLSHIDYSHRDSLAPPLAVRVGETSGVRQDGEVIWSDRRFIGVTARIKGETSSPPAQAALRDHWINVRWQAPSVMLLVSNSAPTGTDDAIALNEVRHTHIFTPETASTCHYWYGVSRPKQHFTAEQTQAEHAMLSGPFLTEDKPLLAEQQIAMGDDDFWGSRPLILPGDAAAIRARRLLEKMIRTEMRAPIPVAEEAIRPVAVDYADLSRI